MKTFFYPSIGILITTLILCSCSTFPKSDLRQSALIPQPVEVTSNGKIVQFTPKTRICLFPRDTSLIAVAEYLQQRLQPATGFPFTILKTTATRNNSITLRLKNDTTLGKEGYRLNIASRNINLTACQPAGIFRGMQTLLQLLPPEIEASVKQQVNWTIPGGTITDYPRYCYRGIMLDVARHFFPVKAVKHYIDLAAAYKINRLHLHLSDDQGWRIAIKHYPELTQKGGQTEVGGGPGGFYSQQDYKSIVAYAASRFITVIPEIDMPGHTNAALASCPRLNCDNKAPKLYTGINVGFSSLCTNKAYTYQFIDQVIGELATITPGPYIHIGGDESHATSEKDYIPFIERIEKIVHKHHKTMIGWEEIAKASLDSSSVAQYWANDSAIQLASKKGMRLIFSPANKIYLDMKYDSLTPLGLHWAGYVDVRSSYQWDPSTIVKNIHPKQIIGLEAPLWTETITNTKELEYMVFPKLPGIAEIGWSPQKERNWSGYKQRLARFGQRFRQAGIQFYPSPKVPWTSKPTAQKQEKESQHDHNQY